MKTVSKIFQIEIFANSINRNLIFIFFFGLLAAVTIVSAAVILFSKL